MNNAAPVLIVDDDALDVMIMKKELSRAGYAHPVDAAMSVQEGLATVRRSLADDRRPILVLLDLNLPIEDGFAFLRACRGEPDLGAVPVAMITTSAHSKDREQALALGAVHFATKPSDRAGFSQLFDELAPWLQDDNGAPR